MSVKAAFVHGENLDRLQYPEDCPFNTSRAGKTLHTCRSMGFLAGPDRSVIGPEPAQESMLLRFHTRPYLDALRAGSQGILDATALFMGLGTPDCPIFRDMFDYPLLAAGATLTGARLIAQGDVGVAFNPSGGFHHAHASSAAGFCYINDIVMGCLALADQGMRVLAIDVDAHHCDGVQEAFYARRDVMTLSFHETGKMLFPGTGFEEEVGEGDGVGFTVNVPLPVGTDDRAYLRVFDAIALPLLKAYDPDVIVLELGMDSLAGDPLAHLHLTNNAFADVAERLLGAGKPILATGGGGYHVENTVRGWVLIWSILCGEAAYDEGSFGLGGVMLANREWQGGLRDRTLISDGGIRRAVDAAIDETIEKLHRLVFPHHGL